MGKKAPWIAASRTREEAIRQTEQEQTRAFFSA